jgi:hypothetical protein
MMGTDIKPGGEYAYREKRRQRTPLEHVRVIERVRSRWRIEWLEPNRGLQDFVQSTQIIVPWDERDSYVHDENQWAALASVSGAQWPARGHPVSDAVDTVFESTGEDIWVGSYGTLHSPSDVFGRILRRAQIECPVEPPGYVDRQGEVLLPFSSALRIAQAFAAAESQTVLFTVDMAEQKYESAAREPDDLLVPLVQHWKAGWALCRQWAGLDQAIAQRDAEIERLKRTIEDIRYELRSVKTRYPLDGVTPVPA